GSLLGVARLRDASFRWTLSPVRGCPDSESADARHRQIGAIVFGSVSTAACRDVGFWVESRDRHDVFCRDARAVHRIPVFSENGIGRRRRAESVVFHARQESVYCRRRRRRRYLDQSYGGIGHPYLDGGSFLRPHAAVAWEFVLRMNTP